jgi:hypothetical protein
VFFISENFVKFFSYHLIFFLGGPLVIPVIWAIDGLALAFNMGFVGCNYIVAI